MHRVFTTRLLAVYGGGLRFSLVIGLVYGLAVGGFVFKPPLAGALMSALATAVYAVLFMAVLGGAEIFLPRTRLGEAMARWPFLAVVAVKTVAYSALIVTAILNKLGPRTALLAFDADTAGQIAAQLEASVPRGLVVGAASLVVFFMILLRQATLLIGTRSFRDIALGRYRRPRTEERFFLFIDIVGSTPVAERLGPLAVHRYLDRVFHLSSDPIDEHGGDVFQYVGDEIVVTWTVPEGRAGARPLACFFAVEEALAQAAPDFEREFGARPALRAALHAGEVVTGETGGSRRAIVFHGDVMNTTSRLENLTRELERPFLVSEDALQRMEGAGAWALEDLGLRQLRGREAAVRVYAARRAP